MGEERDARMEKGEARRRVEQAGAGRMDGIGIAKEARSEEGDDVRRVQGLGEAFPQ